MWYFDVRLFSHYNEKHNWTNSFTMDSLFLFSAALTSLNQPILVIKTDYDLSIAIMDIK